MTYIPRGLELYLDSVRPFDRFSQQIEDSRRAMEQVIAHESTDVHASMWRYVEQLQVYGQSTFNRVGLSTQALPRQMEELQEHQRWLETDLLRSRELSEHIARWTAVQSDYAQVYRGLTDLRMRDLGWHAAVSGAFSGSFADSVYDNLRFATTLSEPVLRLSGQLSIERVMRSSANLEELASAINDHMCEVLHAEGLQEALGEIRQGAEGSDDPGGLPEARFRWFNRRLNRFGDKPSGLMLALLIYPACLMSDHIKVDRLPEVTRRYIELVENDPRLVLVSFALWAHLMTNPHFLQCLIGDK